MASQRRQVGVDGKVRNGRTSRERLNARNLKAQRRQPCARCGQPIDYSLPWDDPGAFSVGHIKPWTTHPHLREDPGNLQPEHRRCNVSAQTSTAPSLGVTSTDW